MTNAGIAVTFEIGGNNQSTEFDGVVVDGSGSSTVALTKAGAGRLTLGGENAYSGVTAIVSGTLDITNATAITNVLTNAGGVNNIGGFLILDYTNSTDPAAAVLSLLVTAYNGGANSFQTGQIRDTGATSLIGLGWVDNTGTYQVTIMPAIYGDLNLDGTAGLADLNTIQANYGKSGMSWSQGDFNYDGVVGFADLIAVLSNYGKSGPLNIADAP